tara:strand:+ start:175 stop:1242 length:1068 start_codon:yes stop_codon:yes gene_type:complete
MKKVEDILSDILSEIKNKQRRQALIKIFNLLLRLNYKKNFIKEELKFNKNFFSVPSKLLEKENKRYKPLINLLLENDIIEYYTHYIDNDPNREDPLFGKSKKTASYSTIKKQSIQYRILIDVSECEIEPYECEYNWYNTTKRSLEKLDLFNKVGRCLYGRRVHTIFTRNMSLELGGEMIKSYKKYFNQVQSGLYSSIDIHQSQPTFLSLLMKKMGYEDKLLFDIIDSDTDIYYFIQDQLELSTDRIEGRNKAKKLFQRFISKNEKDPKIKALNNLFSGVYLFKNTMNVGDYKNTSRLLQREESSFFIDEVFEKEIDLDFCITIHDSFIVKNEYVDELFNKLNNKYPQFKFKKEGM